jgi:hypothetical protein
VFPAGHPRNPVPPSSPLQLLTSNLQYPPHAPLRSAFPRAMLAVENFRMTGDNQHARGSYGRAGIDPRRKPIWLRFATACADSPAQFPPYGVDVRTCFPGLLVTHHLPLATAFLIATVANSEIGSRHSKHWTSPFSNRNKNTLSGFQIFSMTLYPEPAAAATARPTGLLAGNVLAGEAALRARFQPPASCSQPPAPRSIMGLRRGVQTSESNRNKVRIEFAATYSKQRIGTNSNRNYFRGPCISFFSAIRRFGDSATSRGPGGARRDSGGQSFSSP